MIGRPARAAMRARGETLRRSWRRALVSLGDTSRAGPFRGVLSAALVALFVALGWSAMPLGAALRPSTGLLVDPLVDQAADDPACGVAAAVFALRADGTAVRFGDARTDDPAGSGATSGHDAACGAIRLKLYDPLDPLLEDATEAVSLPGDARLLWLLASDDERRRLRAMAADLAAGLSESAVTILRSPEFVADYRDRLTEIVQSALLRAWRDTRTETAWTELLAACDPLLREVAQRELRPIAARHFDGIAARLLQANAITLIDVFHDRDWDAAPVEQALKAMAAELRDREIPERTAAKLLGAPEATHFLRVVLGVAGDTLLHSQDLIDLLARAAVDPRFRPALSAAMGPAGRLARTAPKLLLALHGSTDLNLVAPFVIRAMVGGRQDRVVVLMSAAQRREIEAVDAGAMRRLRWLAAS